MSADRGQLAYEARWEGHKLGERGAAPAWDDLGEEGRAVWRRIAEKLADDQTARFLAESDTIEREEALRQENRRLRVALHDAIRRPLGVTPDSAVEFYDQRQADEAEARRAGGGHL
ncbi:hypothetical protein [Methylobacterium aquaticum]|uniref:Uncharacterized protein n=1 Tax=Methylobacterium aquaticum TaxID=270351 RepID=A0A0C6F7N7_9HYPH|nr:hypothetical protein [Methylobacterium aquaticum]BAQ44343.1 hypothetical protein Maq22A_c04640 [Methylobacterium aquaticum]